MATSLRLWLFLGLCTAARASLESELTALKYKLASGEEVTFDELMDDAEIMLLVNTATGCGFTEIAYEEMEALHQHYPMLRVVSAPSNTFNQEPYMDQQISKICAARYDSSFTFLSRMEVNGMDTAPLFQVLKKRVHEDCQNADQECESWARDGECESNPEQMQETCPLSCGECEIGAGGFSDEPIHVKWNFEKWLIMPDGEIVGRFAFSTSPLAIEEHIRFILEVEEEDEEDMDGDEDDEEEEEGEDEDL